MEPEPFQMDYQQCLVWIQQYLIGQGWILVPTEALAAQTWLEIEGRLEPEQPLKKMVQDRCREIYSAALHDLCREPGGERSEQAWHELKTWLEQRVKFLSPPPPEPEVTVQETLIELHRRLRDEPLKTPRSFLVYALQVLRRTQIDHFRRRMAKKRGEELTIYLEDMTPDPNQPDESSWEDRLQPKEGALPDIETELANEEKRRSLRDFFRAHLPSDLQAQVAEAHFIDGLSPIEIAGLMGKQPHEIRMLKARAVNTLRNLPPDLRQQLLDILGSL